jgi:hypothetical protein
MTIRDWKDDWRVPVLTQDIPTGKEADAGQVETYVRDKAVPKKPNPSQKSVQ